MLISHQAHLQALQSSTNKHPAKTKTHHRGRQAQFRSCVFISFIHIHAVHIFVRFLCVPSYVLVYLVLMFGVCLYPITPTCIFVCTAGKLFDVFPL